MKKSPCIAILIFLILPCFAEKAVWYVGSEALITDAALTVMSFADSSPEAFTVPLNLCAKVDYYCFSLIVGTHLFYSQSEDYPPELMVCLSLQPEIYFVNIRKISKFGIGGFAEVGDSIRFFRDQRFMPAIFLGPYVTNATNVTDRVVVKNDLGAMIYAQGTALTIFPLLRSGILIKIGD